MSQPTICFITMCKNEEHCILDTLKSVAHIIDYWIVCDTGSTDNTCNLVKDFFNEKNIPGELHVDEWKGFDKNKTLMFERGYKKADYVLHLDADDIMVGTFNKSLLSIEKKDIYNFNYIRGSCKFKTSSLYNNNLKWIYVGVAHNLIKCIDKHSNITHSDIFVTDDLYVDNNERGARRFDPEKYIKDALKLKDQFFETLFDDPHDLRRRSVFYAAQSYMDAGYYKEAIQWYTLYLEMKNTWEEEVFEATKRIGECMIILNQSENKIIHQLEKAIAIFPDRAEPFYILGKYFNNKSNCHVGYYYLSEAKKKDIQQVLSKYVLFINKYSYGKWINDELSVSCFWTDRFEEGLQLMNEIIEDPDFQEQKERLLENKLHMMRKLYLI